MFDVLRADESWQIEELEAAAEVVREFQPVYILSRLRTPAYQASLMVGAAPVHPPTQANPARMSMIMTESALRWRCAPPGVLASQMRHLLAVMREPTAGLAIIPADAPICRPVGHAFHLYGDIAVVVGILGAKVISRTPATVRAYRDAFDALLSSALTGPDASGLIDGIMDSYRDEHERTGHGHSG